MADSSLVTRWLPTCWALVLAVLLLGPALGPGYPLLRDMVWVPDLSLRADVVGLGTALPRAVPSDAVVAVLDQVVPGSLLAKLVLLGALTGAGSGAAVLVGGGPVGRLVAVSVAVWSPFVVERLLMGHWPVLLGYAAVPWLAVAGERVAASGRLPVWTPLVLLAGSTSASAGLVSAAVLLATALAGGVRRRRTVLLLLAAIVVANAPWIVAGLTHAARAADAGGYRVFATTGDALPAPLAALTLGGIWNADVVPASREGALAWVWLAALVLLAFLGWRPWRKRLGPQAGAHALLWALGLGIAVVSWAAPGGLSALGEQLPGIALLRDGSRSLALALPATVGLAAAGAERLVASVPGAQARWSLALAAVLLPLAVLPDAAWGAGGQLRSSDYPADWRAAAAVVRGSEGDAVILPWGAYRAPAWNGHRPVLDPLARLVDADVVVDGDLVVGGATIPGEDPRAAEVARALSAGTPQARADALRRAGVRWVLVERDAGDAPTVAGAVALDSPQVRVVRLGGEVRGTEVARGDAVAQGAAWAAYVLLALIGFLALARRIYVMLATRRRCAATV